ncbi:hypothetical protein C4573_04270 [Candidatus Woesearchaeota archaeon]|nr:MAG: hypothetical protein C4573_04270 [Candidatus Woesearchaeota archaeon]
MAEESVFRGTLVFFEKLGIYDVILPFLLTFTLTFAILEKTKIYGTEKDEKGKDVTRKNLNSMTAFCIAFFVVASSKIVAVINQTLAYIVLLLLLSIGFMLLAGSFHKGDKEFFLVSPWKEIFMVIMFVGIALIFLYSLGWLDVIYEWLRDHWDTNVVSGIILVVLVIVFMLYVTKDNNKKDKKKEGDENG